MKRIIVLMTSLALITACDDLTVLNNNPKQSAVAPAGALFASAQKALVDDLTSPNVNLNIFRLFAQQWTETTYTDESNYDLATRNIPQNWWHALYRDVLRDLREARNVTEEEKALSAAVQKNRKAIVEILEVYTWSVIVNTFGNIPYRDALKVTASDDDILQPAYDEANYIFEDLIARLNLALSDLNITEESWGESDLLYGGDVSAWHKLGNSIKLQLGMMLADVNVEKARAVVESAAPYVFTSNEDNAIFRYKSAPPNTNPIWVNLVQSGRKDFVAANTLVDKMVDLADPRMPFYFTVDASGVGFSGGEYGASNSYATYSKPGDMVDNADFPAILMDFADVEFYLAEAIERGFTVPGTASGHYENAVTASLKYWGVKDADIAIYVSRPEVAYATAEGGNHLHAIGLQKWIALYNRGFDAWTEWRRMDYPILLPPTDAVSDIPLRFTYPVSEQNLNTINYAAAVEAIGGDNVTTPLFWDVN